MRPCTWPVIVACLILGVAASAQQQASWHAALDFEVEGAWRTAPDLLEEFTADQLWATRSIPFEELAGGVALTEEHVRSGSLSGRWADHPRYPTIHCPEVPADWSRWQGVGLWAWSEAATSYHHQPPSTTHPPTFNH